jgi:hypothetical protein
MRDNGRYVSAVEDLARICSLSDWRNVQMLTLRTALDCSQDRKRQYFVMAGFVSSAERWTDFDGEWRKRLAGDELAYFHMHSFTQCIHGSAGPFDDTWIGKEDRRQRLLADLLGIIQAHAWQKFAGILPVNSFRMFSDETKKDFVPTMIATAGRLIWADVEVWRKREKFQDQTRMVFEDGDLEKGSLIDAIKDLTGRSPAFELKKDDPEKGLLAFTPLQAADILAYEAQKLTQKFDDPVNGIDLRFPYHELERIPGDIKVLRPDGVHMLDEMMRVVQFFEKNPLPPKTVQ